MKQFETYANDIVRPLRASPMRKATMREEILGHLTQSYTDMLRQGESEEAACQQALSRLGEPDELRRRLQASVPKLERLLFFRLGIRKNSETDARYAARMAGWAVGFILLLVLFAAMTGVLIGKRPFAFEKLQELLGVFCWGIPMLFVVVFLLLLCEIRHLRLFQQGQTFKAVRLTLLWSFICGCIPISAALIASWHEPYFKRFLPEVFLGSIIFVVLIETIELGSVYWVKKKHPWAELGKDI